MLAYVLYSLLLRPDIAPFRNISLSPQQLQSTLLQLMTGMSALELGFLAGGVAAGIFLFRMRSFALAVTSTLLGMLSGLVVYAVGYVAYNYPYLPTSSYYAVYFLEAVYSFTIAEVFAVVLGAMTGFLVAQNVWRFHGVLTYVALISVVLGYFMYSFTVTLPQVPAQYKTVSWVLMFAEGASLFMVVVYAFYALDTYVKVGWNRAPKKVSFSKYYLPKVAFHVPCYNEPPEVVIETLKGLMGVDYPKDRYEIIVADDSTDEKTLKLLMRFCKEHKIAFLRRENRTGFKAGALNHALSKTSSDVEIVAIIDADYIIEKNYLKETVGYFVNPNLGFLQTPQDFRNKYQSFLTEHYYYADSYFYRAVMPSRNEANSIIFAGTMGMIRKEVIQSVGGWGEQFICEDAELSVRILKAGYESLYINKTFGRGLIPHTFEGYQKQLYRWAFGGVKILKAHFLNFFFSRMSLRQKFDFLIGGIHWFDGMFVLVISGILAFLAVGDLLNLDFVTYHQREVWLVGLVPVFLLIDGTTRLHMALRKAIGLDMGKTLRVMGIWFSIKFNNLFAALKALFGVRIPFVRTPKVALEEMPRWKSFLRAISVTKFETSVFLLLFGLAATIAGKDLFIYGLTGKLDTSRLLLTTWLLFYGGIFLCAPFYAYKSYTTLDVKLINAYIIGEKVDMEVVAGGRKARKPLAARTLAGIWSVVTLKGMRPNLVKANYLETDELSMERLLDGSLEEIQGRLKHVENPDYEELIVVEKNGFGRRDVLNYLQQQKQRIAGEKRAQQIRRSW